MSQLEPNPKDLNTTTQGPRVVLVDDNPEGRRGLARLLELSGFQVESYPDGGSAVAALGTGLPPDIVLTDFFLPDGDGREVAQAAGALVPRPYIALVTGWDLSEEGQIVDGVIDRIFLKPVDIRSLLETLRGVIHDRTSGSRDC